MDNRTYVYIEPEKYLMDVLALLRSFYAEMDIKPVVPESSEDVKADAERTGYFFTIKIDADGNAAAVFSGKEYRYTSDELINAPYDEADDFTVYKKALCRKLYSLFREDTGRDLPWGMMNGVRPTKPAFICALAGRGKSEAAGYYRDEYLVTDEKIDM
nr:hypothetical protein [Lachnospiraceae bacterium]